MLYKDIINKLMKRSNMTQADMAVAIGMNSQAALSKRLKDSWNPGLGDTERMLGQLGYKVCFVPESTKMADGWYEPELPEKPEGK